MSLVDEIREQPQVLARLLDKQAEPIRALARSFAGKEIHGVVLAARGTSDNAGVYAQYLWGAFNRMPVALAAPSLFSLYKRPPELKHVLVLGISQSGQSPDIVEVLEEGRRQGVPTLAIGNDPDSPLARAADAFVDICAGPERAVAATKTYTAQLMAIAMLSAAVAGDEERWRELAAVPALVAQALALDDEIGQRAERYRFMEHCVVLGRGFNYATAFEWALKLKELTYVIAEPDSSADFQHGPVAMLDRGLPGLRRRSRRRGLQGHARTPPAPRGGAAHRAPGHLRPRRGAVARAHAAAASRRRARVAEPDREHRLRAAVLLPPHPRQGLRHRSAPRAAKGHPHAVKHRPAAARPLHPRRNRTSADQEASK